MNLMPKILITSGILLIVVGLLWQVGGKYLALGRLPGDIVVKKENFTFYFPLMTSIILSILLSVILYLIKLFK